MNEQLNGGFFVLQLCDTLSISSVVGVAAPFKIDEVLLSTMLLLRKMLNSQTKVCVV